MGKSCFGSSCVGTNEKKMYWHVDCFSFRNTTEEGSVDLSLTVKKKKKRRFSGKTWLSIITKSDDLVTHPVIDAQHWTFYDGHTFFVQPCVRLSLYWPYSMVSQGTVTVTCFLWWYQIHMKYAINPKTLTLSLDFFYR